MDLAGILTRARSTAVARMTDSCVITSGGAVPVYDEVTDTYLAPSSTVYVGPCRVKMPNAVSLEPEAGDVAKVVIRPEVHIPSDVVGVKVGSTVTITYATFNPSLAGAVFRVTSLFRDSQATAQRLDCTEVQ